MQYYSLFPKKAIRFSGNMFLSSLVILSCYCRGAFLEMSKKIQQSLHRIV